MYSSNSILTPQRTGDPNCPLAPDDVKLRFGATFVEIVQRSISHVNSFKQMMCLLLSSSMQLFSGLHRDLPRRSQERSAPRRRLP